MNERSQVGGKAVRRRDFLRGASSVSLCIAMSGAMPAHGRQASGGQPGADYPIPREKRLSAAWLKALTDRGEPTRYRGWDELKYIGMPISGIGTGTVYIGGDGKLWCWDIFNEPHEGVVPNDDVKGFLAPSGKRFLPRHGSNYVEPPVQRSPWQFEQGFSVTITENGAITRRTLDNNGFSDIEFTGQAPVAKVRYADPSTALIAHLEALTPYIPLETDQSSCPATIMGYRFENTGHAPLEIEVTGWLHNPVLRSVARQTEVRAFNERLTGAGYVGTIAKAESPSGRGARDEGSIALIARSPDAVVRPADADLAASMVKADMALDTDRPLGTVTVRHTLAPQQSVTADFVIGWFFPNVDLQIPAEWGMPKFPAQGQKRWYATRFTSAGEVVAHVADKLDDLRAKTRAWRDTWYDGTLPHWLLERAIIPANALQTSTVLRFDDGRFWGFEGVGFPPGLCTHVWHYAQASGHLFPSLERDARERTDLGIGMLPSGEISFRAEFHLAREGGYGAVDGQAGVILRALREHRMTEDKGFLTRIYPRVKKAMDFMIRQDSLDGPADGILVGEQHNTLDAAWFGKVPNLSSLYVAALRAAEHLARDAGDTDYAVRCAAIAQRGYRSLLALYRSDYGYFVQEEDPNNVQTIGIGTGCYIDQVIGQWWAHQLGLGRLTDGSAVRSALNQLWENNFAPDIGPLRGSVIDRRMKGRPYSLPGEAGLVMCTWPNGGRSNGWEKHWQYGYFNETMTGFEHQVAAHMIWESREEPDLLGKGLAIARAVHDRYGGTKRNPFNEIECSDHYARAMASYSVFLAACGFEYDGPAGHLGFKPRLMRNSRFKAAFTTAGGWGSFAQTATKDGGEAVLTVVHGQVQIKTIALQVEPRAKVSAVSTSHGAATFEQSGRDVRMEMSERTAIAQGDRLTIRLAY